MTFGTRILNQVPEFQQTTRDTLEQCFPILPSFCYSFRILMWECTLKAKVQIKLDDSNVYYLII